MKNYDTTNIEKGNDEYFEIRKLSIKFSSIKYQENIIDNNITDIDFTNCEILLRKFYNLTHNETLYLRKIDIKQDKMRIPKILYSVYYNLLGTKLERLNLSICQNAKIFLYLPVKINENIDTLNSISGYFNDICYTATSESGTDIIL